jgi:hypothetical protein
MSHHVTPAEEEKVRSLARHMTATSGREQYVVYPQVAEISNASWFDALLAEKGLGSNKELGSKAGLAGSGSSGQSKPIHNMSLQIRIHSPQGPTLLTMTSDSASKVWRWYRLSAGPRHARRGGTSRSGPNLLLGVPPGGEGALGGEPQ